MALYDEIRALYEGAFAGEDARFTDALFAAYFPHALRVIEADGKPVSMLFSIPYPVVSGDTVLDARYLYGIATDPAYRGRGYARELIGREAAAHPVFLRPMSEGLFAFYQKAGLLPFSPIETLCGAARAEGDAAVELLTPAAYLALRDKKLPVAHCRMSEQFLGVAASTGGMLACGDAVSLFDREGDTVLFKEWWGDPALAPHVAAQLQAARYELRLPRADGTPFGVMRGLPQDAVFLAAMD